MARMHSRKKGKSKSRRPINRTVPDWVKLTEKEVKLLVVKYAKDGRTASEIGATLRDEHGLPDVKALAGQTITQILAEKKMLGEIPEDLLSLIKKAVMIKDHLEENSKDETAKRGLILTESKIRRLAKYYKGSGKLPANWKYDPNKIKLYVQ